MTVRMTPAMMRREMVEREVRRYMVANPPAGGLPPSDEQVRAAVATFMAANPVPAGRDGVDGKNGRDGTDGQNGSDGKDGRNGADGANGRDGVDGKSATQEQVAAAVAAFFQANPVRDGRDGTNGRDGKDGKDGVNGRDGATPTDAQIASAIAAYLTANPPARGLPGDTRVKYAKAGLLTGNTGVYTAPLGGPGTFTGVPAVVIQPRGASPRVIHSYTLTGSAAAGFTITVTFVQMRDAVSIALLGTVNLTVGITSPVAFDLIAMEQT